MKTQEKSKKRFNFLFNIDSIEGQNRLEQEIVREKATSKLSKGRGINALNDPLVRLGIFTRYANGESTKKLSNRYLVSEYFIKEVIETFGGNLAKEYLEKRGIKKIPRPGIESILNKAIKIQSTKNLERIAQELDKRGITADISNEYLKEKIDEYGIEKAIFLTNQQFEYIRERLKGMK
jgi:hypothetical protein